ncbi:MAG: caspase family protein [Chthonomonas sp.]|nr:caspase family protein [Chthonomonas sp.]
MAKLQRFGWLLVLVLQTVAAWAQAGATGELPFLPTRKWAVVVGASKYDHLPALRYASRDAGEFARVLREDMGFQSDRVALLSDAADSINLPTTENIRATLKRVLSDKSLDRGDLFIFYFSGHGTATKTGDYLLPTDAKVEDAEKKGLPVRDLVSSIVQAGLKNVLILCDACRSGAKNEFGREFQELGTKANLAVMLGCEPGGRSYEYPQLKGSAFAHFWFEALKDTTLRNPVSGSLWASAVAEKVRKDVLEYTAPDYGEEAQRPVPWTEGSQDVLLGAYVSGRDTQTAVKEFLAETTQRDVAGLSTALVAYSEAIFLDGDGSETIELLKTAERLGEITPYGRYLLGLALQFAGRSAESARTLDELAKQTDSDYYRALAIVSNPRRTDTSKERVAAALKLWADSPDSVTGALVLSMLQLHGDATGERAFLTEFVKAENIDDRERLAAKATMQIMDADLATAKATIKEALSKPGVLPPDSALVISYYAACMAEGANDEAVHFLNEWNAKEPQASYEIFLAGIAKAEGNEEAAQAHLIEAMDLEISPDQMILMVRLTGLSAGVVRDKMLAKAKETPYSWKARLVEMIARALSGDSKNDDLVAEMEKYADDPLNIMLGCYPTVDVLLTELVAKGAVDPMVVGTLLSVYSGSMIPFVSDFQFDPDVWVTFMGLALRAERNNQVGFLVNRNLAPKLEALSDKLRAVLCIGSLCVGNFELADKAMSKGRVSDQKWGSNWIYAMSLATRGREAEAKKWIEGQPVYGDLQSINTAFLVYLQLGDGKTEGAREALMALDADPLSIQWRYLAWRRLGDVENAKRCLEQLRSTRNWSTMFVDTFALGIAYNDLVTAKDVAGVNSFAYDAAISFAGNPLMRTIRYAGVSKPSDLKGSLKFKVVCYTDAQEYVNGTMAIKVDGKGVVTGSLLLDDQPAGVIKATVDEYGNLKGTCVFGKFRWEIAAKLAPEAMYKTDANLRERSQVFELMDPEGSRLLVNAFPPEVERAPPAKP